MSPESEGGANELNANQKLNEDDDGDQDYEENQEAQGKHKVFKD
jgi:hypothetical protein